MRNSSTDLKRLRCIHFGSYWMGKNDIVNAMVTDLKKTCKTTAIDVDIYSSKKKIWYIEDFAHSKQYPVRILVHKKLLQLVEKIKPDFVVLNAGGLCLSNESIQYLQKKNIVTVGISLSDPDVYEDQGKNYAHLFDIFFTNSEYSIKNQYHHHSNTLLLPFAASTKIHKPLSIKKTCDIVVVGHARPERIELIRALTKDFSIKTYGKGWGNQSKEVHGTEQVRAINQGKIYLSFPQTHAGFTNVKVGLFEAAACKSCIVVPQFPELEKYFTYGIDILGFSDRTSLHSLLRYYLQHEKMRRWIASNAYTRCIQEHTWETRWKYILAQVQKVRYERYRKS